jgi:hypothetical protein
MKQKLMSAMDERDVGKPKFSGRGELDDACVGWVRSRGKRGRGAARKTPFVVAAVETSLVRHPKRLKLQVVKGFRKGDVAKLAQSSFAAGTNVVSDGLSWWQAVTTACAHFPIPTGSGRKAAQWPSFN